MIVEDLLSLKDVVNVLGVPYYRVYYLLYTGKIPEPRKIGTTRVFTKPEVKRIRELLQGKGENE
jgi:predicted DNA-binding transcriptional regulator AlpA